MGIKFFLKDDWDQNINAPTSDNETGHFYGRQKELNLFVSELSRRKNGSILVSGHRGVGKTSFVYKALWNLKKQTDNVIPVLLNASQLGVLSKNNDDDSKSQVKILENLIRRLYSNTKNSSLNAHIKKEIADLYFKSVASEYNKIIENEIKEVREKSQQVSKKLTITLKSIVCFSLIAILLTVLELNKIQLPKLLENDIIPFIKVVFYFLPAFYISRKFYYYRKEQKTASAKTVYNFDNNIGNLEEELCEIHNKIKKEKYKIVYVIDEMDKIQITEFKALIRFFKNFLTISNAIFIFISGEQAYSLEENRCEDDKDDHRSLPYTYFTSKYFLARPSWDDLKFFLEEIFEIKSETEKGEENKKKTLNDLIRSLCFDAKDDFFDLIKEIKNRIDFFQEQSSINKNSEGITRLLIEFEGDETSIEDFHKAVMHEIVHMVFSYYQKPSINNFYENEKIRRTLFEYAHDVCKYDIKNKSLQTKNFSDFKNIDQDRKNNEEIILFNAILEQSGTLKQSNGSKRIDGFDYNQYTHTGNLPLIVPEKINAILPEEAIYLASFDDYGNYINVIVNFYGSLNNKDRKEHFSLLNKTASKELEKIYNIVRVGLYHIREMDLAIDLYMKISNKNNFYNAYTKHEILSSEKTMKSYLLNLKALVHYFIAYFIYELCLYQKENYKIKVFPKVGSGLYNHRLNKLLETLPHSHIIIWNKNTNRTVIFITVKNSDVLSTHKEDIQELSPEHIIIPIGEGQNVNSLENHVNLVEGQFNEDRLLEIKDIVLSHFGRPVEDEECEDET